MMTDILRGSFEALPYRHGSIADSHIARIGAIARLVGWAAAEPDRCRVLEIGCAEGLNLLPMADRIRTSEFVGVDFGEAHIRVGEAVRVAGGLENASLICADLREWQPEPESFDYVIAHGVYSWVPPEVRDRLLQACARGLRPNGVAYISYNVYPAWGPLMAIRRAVLSEIAHLTEMPERIARTTLVLETLHNSFANDERPYAIMMRELIAEMMVKPAPLLHHDDLESINEPCTFLEFATHARTHGLQFLAEAHYASMPFEHVRPEVRTALSVLDPDFVHGQHLLDLIGNRRFRNTLLCRSASEPERVVNPDIIRDCALGIHLGVADARIDLQTGVPLQVIGRHNLRLSIDKPFQKAFIATLIAARPDRITYAEARHRAEDLLRRGNLPTEIDDDFMAVALFRLFALDQLDLMLAGNGEWLKTNPKPTVSALVRHQAQQALPIVNRWHENMNLNATEKRWLAGAAVRLDTDGLSTSGVLA